MNLRDLHIYGGLGLAAWGGWQLAPTWTCIALGVVLTVMGVFAPRLGKGH